MMNCKYFSLCGSCTLYGLSYEEQFKKKIDFMKNEFREFDIKDFELFRSKESRFRDRAEFRIFHKDNKISYAMNRIDKKAPLEIDSCEIVNNSIYSLMPSLKREIEKNLILKEKLFAIEFLSSSTRDILITLIYHKKIDEMWQKEANILSKKLNTALIGRSRKIKTVINRDFIEEKLKTGEKEYLYRYFENSFTQPNSSVNSQMISWTKNKSISFSGDLLELYCGHGNFTIPLSENFNRVLATEISKTSIKSALFNAKLNGVKNITFVRLSSEELTSALKKERVFRRLEGVRLDDYDFKTVFVDPPRAGLDEKTREFVKNFDNIIYISCNPVTLKRDLKDLTKVFDIKSFALFDQFPYTNHLESGVILQK